MSDQMMSFDEKKNVAKNFIDRTNPYEKNFWMMKFDLRGYSKYLRENNIPGNQVPPSVLEMFKK